MQVIQGIQVCYNLSMINDYVFFQSISEGLNHLLTKCMFRYIFEIPSAIFIQKLHTSQINALCIQTQITAMLYSEIYINLQLIEYNAVKCWTYRFILSTVGDECFGLLQCRIIHIHYLVNVQYKFTTACKSQTIVVFFLCLLSYLVMPVWCVIHR